MALPRIYPTVVHMLLEAVERAPDREALVCDGETLTYADYLRCVAGLANELREMGVAGERVALILGNSLDICVAFFAAHLARAQLTPLNPMYTDRELRPMLVDAAPRVLIHDESQHDRDGRLAAELKIPHTIRIGTGPGSRRLIQPQQWRNTKLPADLPLPEELGTLQFTGGTTGRAKGANLTHAATSINISQREVIFPIRDDVERCLCVMPLFHCYASHMNLHAMALHRGTLVVQKRYHPADVLAALAQERITLFGGSPTLFAGLMGFAGFGGADFSHLNLSCSGGSPLPAEMLARWEEQTRTPIIEGYGQTEAGPVISFNPVKGVRKPASVGVAVGETELQIVDVETGTRVLPSGEKGEIRLRGPQLMRDYRNLPEETALALRGGWLYTGDVGELDSDGYLFIRGRKKEMIIVSGYNVFPREVEEVLHGNPAVREVAVVGRPDAYRGELPVAFVVAQDGETLDAAGLGAFCADRLAKYKIPAEFKIVEALPKTTVGKIDKLTLGEMAKSGKGP